MKTFLRLGLLAAILALGVWLWTVFFPPPEKVIRKQLFNLARAASFSDKEGELAALLNSERVGAAFATDGIVDLRSSGLGLSLLEGREQITHAAVAARKSLGSFGVQFADISIMLGAGNQTAQIGLTARGDLLGEKDDIIQELRIYMKKIEGEWLIVRLESVKPLT